MANPKRSRDANQLARFIADLSTGETEEKTPDEGRDPAAVASGWKGGLKGGRASAAKMTNKERSGTARKAANARWNKEKLTELNFFATQPLIFSTVATMHMEQPLNLESILAPNPGTGVFCAL